MVLELITHPLNHPNDDSSKSYRRLSPSYCPDFRLGLWGDSGPFCRSNRRDTSYLLHSALLVLKENSASGRTGRNVPMPFLSWHLLHPLSITMHLLFQTCIPGHCAYFSSCFNTKPCHACLPFTAVPVTPVATKPYFEWGREQSPILLESLVKGIETAYRFSAADPPSLSWHGPH